MFKSFVSLVVLATISMPVLAATQAELNVAATKVKLEEMRTARQVAMDAANKARGDARVALLAQFKLVDAAAKAANGDYWKAAQALVFEQRAASKGVVAPPVQPAEPELPAGAMVVANNLALDSAIKGLPNGSTATIVLRGGTYTQISINMRKFGHLTIQGMPGEVAVVKGIALSASENITMKGLQVTIASDADVRKPLLSVGKKSKNITFTDGNLMGPIDYLTEGGSIGWGVHIRDVDGFTLHKSKIRDVGIGGVFDHVSNLKVTDNDLQELRRDGMDFVGIRKGLISGNLINNMKRVGTEHPDHIQFWGKADDEYSADVTIENNRLLSPNAQGIFMRCYNECPMNSYTNVVIRNNVIVNGFYNGIVLAGATGGSVENNLVVHTKGGETAYTWISLSSLKDVAIKGNLSNGYTFKKLDMNTVDPSNLIISPALGTELAKVPSQLGTVPGANKLTLKEDRVNGGYYQALKQ